MRLPFFLILGASVGWASIARSEEAKTDFSVAERLLFMTPQLQALTLPATLRYSFTKSGSLEPPFADTAAVAVTSTADGKCCDASGSFLSGERQQRAPEVTSAQGNPVILYFLEYDLRQMKRLTGGSEAHFRKRLRMAIYQGAQVRDVTLRYQGSPVQGKEIVLSPFLDDPNRPRYEKYAKKSYRFLLSPEVPGGVYGVDTQIPGEAAGAAPLLAEQLLLDGAQPMPRATPRTTH